MKPHWFWLSIAILFSVVIGVGGSSYSAQAQADSFCFSQTNQCISGPIRAYWEKNGGLSVFGYPITAVRTEKLGDWIGPTQWFERDRLEDHGAQGVMAGRLGAYLLQLQNRSWQNFPTATQPLQPSCSYFQETKHSLCEPFLSYWQRNGGLERFGYPITEPLFETINGQWTGNVQYFERRRMELHTELSGTPILLGLLGREVLDTLDKLAPKPTLTATATTTTTHKTECLNMLLPAFRTIYDQIPFHQELGCPQQQPLTSIQGSTQACENGMMIWINRGATYQATTKKSTRQIYAVVNPGPTFKEYIDDWDAHRDPYELNMSSPSGYYPPRGGFGKVWKKDLDLRNAIGWAVEKEERERKVTVQDFDGGTMILIQESGTIYVFGNPSKPYQVHVFVRR